MTEAIGGGSPQPLKVLLLEDSAFDAELLNEALLAAYPRATVHLVSDGEAYATAICRGGFDVILSDHELGGYSGDEALALARERVPYVPFIFVSGVIGEDNAVELLKRGATDYVSKLRLSRLPLVLERAMREIAERAARAKAETGLRLAKEEAERASHAKDRFLAVLSHELRTPLASVSFATHLLLKVATVPERYADLLPTIQRNVSLEARLIDDLLDVSAITSGKLAVKPATIDMRDVLAQVVETSREQLAQKGIELVYTPLAAPAWVSGDEARLQQVLSNLLRNAIKFSPAGAAVRLASRVDADGTFVCTCSDDGVGLETEALERIFMAFEQADGDVARLYGGLGLGLAIARHLVDQHGGKLSAQSAGPGRGATFTLRLPGVAEPLPADGAAETPVEMSAAPVGNRVLLVEDNPSAAETLALCLDEYGWQAVHAPTFAAAMQLARDESFDVVLTDLGLPDGNGVDIGRALSPRLPVIALSGYGSAADMARTAAAGFSEHLVKPVDPVVVHEALRRSLGGRPRG